MVTRAPSTHATWQDLIRFEGAHPGRTFELIDVRPPPFDAVEAQVSDLLGDEDD
jgi:hypothetical protein